MTMNKLLVKKLVEGATIPSKNLPTDLGYDLYASEEVYIQPNETKIVSTGIAVKFPVGWGGFIKDRSSIATKKLLTTVAGVIDENYTGEIKVAVKLVQPSHFDVFPTVIHKGDKIAQLVPIPVTNWNIETVDELPETDRGEKGFGSSGN